MLHSVSYKEKPPKKLISGAKETGGAFFFFSPTERLAFAGGHTRGTYVDTINFVFERSRGH